MKTHLSLFLAGAILVATVRAADYQLIAHPAAATTTLSKEDARNILLGNKGKWDNGTVIQLAVLASGPVHQRVIADITARTADQFDKYWKKQVFTGKGVMPEVMPDEAAMVAFVAKTPGAIGYVSSTTKTDGVQIIAIQ